jgi:hypothetical protein
MAHLAGRMVAGSTLPAAAAFRQNFAEPSSGGARCNVNPQMSVFRIMLAASLCRTRGDLTAWRSVTSAFVR